MNVALHSVAAAQRWASFPFPLLLTHCGGGRPAELFDNIDKAPVAPAGRAK
jgi:hypothetical protein